MVPFCALVVIPDRFVPVTVPPVVTVTVPLPLARHYPVAAGDGAPGGNEHIAAGEFRALPQSRRNGSAAGDIDVAGAMPRWMPLVWPLTAPVPSMLIAPVVDVALMPRPPVEVRPTLLVIVVVPVVAEASMTLPLVLPTVPPVSETITLPLPVATAFTALVVPLSAPPVWLMSMVPLPVCCA